MAALMYSVMPAGLMNDGDAFEFQVFDQEADAVLGAASMDPVVYHAAMFCSIEDDGAEFYATLPGVAMTTENTLWVIDGAVWSTPEAAVADAEAEPGRVAVSVRWVD